MNPLHKLSAIHQFHPSCSVGDGVTQSLFFTRRLLRELGFESDIYCQDITPQLIGEVLPLASLPSRDFLLMQHHSLGYRDAEWLDRLEAPRVLIYHNITPAHLLEPGDMPELSRLGRKQLVQWAQACIGAIGDSDYNSQELIDAGYRNVITLPILVDLEQLRERTHDRQTAEQLRDRLNILFVGRINENKRQHELIEVFDEFQHYCGQPARLILAGGVSSGSYGNRLREMASSREPDAIFMPGKVSDAALQALYRVADVFVCLSEHEGFCMPIIEAMAHDVPVVARDAGALASTLGEGGLLLQPEIQDPREIAAIVHTLLDEPGLRRRVLQGQRRNLQRFELSTLRNTLHEYLISLGLPGQVSVTELTEPTWPESHAE